MKKGDFNNDKILWYYNDQKELYSRASSNINSSLSLKIDITSAHTLHTNTVPKKVFQGQTHGHEGFLIPKSVAIHILKEKPEYSEILKPFIIGDELVSNFKSQPERFVIDFKGKDLIEASKFKVVLKLLKEKYFPIEKRKLKSKKKKIKNC